MLLLFKVPIIQFSIRPWIGEKCAKIHEYTRLLDKEVHSQVSRPCICLFVQQPSRKNRFLGGLKNDSRRRRHTGPNFWGEVDNNTGETQWAVGGWCYASLTAKVALLSKCCFASAETTNWKSLQLRASRRTEHWRRRCYNSAVGEGRERERSGVERSAASRRTKLGPDVVPSLLAAVAAGHQQRWRASTHTTCHEDG